jgi:hypothetical protein
MGAFGNVLTYLEQNLPEPEYLLVLFNGDTPLGRTLRPLRPLQLAGERRQGETRFEPVEYYGVEMTTTHYQVVDSSGRLWKRAPLSLGLTRISDTDRLRIRVTLTDAELTIPTL